MRMCVVTSALRLLHKICENGRSPSTEEENEAKPQRKSGVRERVKSGLNFYVSCSDCLGPALPRTSQMRLYDAGSFPFCFSKSLSFKIIFLFLSGILFKCDSIWHRTNTRFTRMREGGKRENTSISGNTNRL